MAIIEFMHLEEMTKEQLIERIKQNEAIQPIAFQAVVELHRQEIAGLTLKIQTLETKNSDMASRIEKLEAKLKKLKP